MGLPRIIENDFLNVKVKAEEFEDRCVKISFETQ